MTNGWTPERRACQAELIRQWRPWEKSTGPKTEAGKRVTSQNAYKGGIEPLVRGLWSVLRVSTQAAYKGDNGQSLLRGLSLVLRKHHQQQEYSRQLRKGHKPEVDRPSADLRPDNCSGPWASGPRRVEVHAPDGALWPIRERN